VAELRWETELGSIHVHGWQRPLMESALTEGLALAREGRRVGAFTEFVGQDVYLKAGPLAGSARLRHGLAWHLLRRRWPRVREYENLSWLIERHFQTVLPLAAGVLLRRGLPHFQFLATARIPGARDLEAVLPECSAELRAGLWEELARELARMHALHFVHHDLYLRNLLLLPRAAPRRLAFLDAWAGGPELGLRGPEYDLACFFLDASEALTEQEQLSFLERYRRERILQQAPLRAGWLERTASLRAGLRRRLVREPQRLRGCEPPRASWPSHELRSDLGL